MNINFYLSKWKRRLKHTLTVAAAVLCGGVSEFGWPGEKAEGQTVDDTTLGKYGTDRDREQWYPVQIQPPMPSIFKFHFAHFIFCLHPAEKKNCTGDNAEAIIRSFMWRESPLHFCFPLYGCSIFCSFSFFFWPLQDKRSKKRVKIFHSQTQKLNQIYTDELMG